MVVGTFVQQVVIQPSATPGGPTVVTQLPPGIPTSREEFRAEIFRRDQLWEQLRQAKDRKTELLDEIRSTSRDSKQLPFLESRVAELNSRIARLENEHYLASDRVASAPPHVLNTAETSIQPDRVAERVMDEIVPLTAIVSTFVLLPLTLAFVRLIWRRSSAPPHTALADQAVTAKRLEQIQQSIDAIAVEVERISEGQRYAAKMMDRALGPGADATRGEKVALHAERR